MAMIWPQLADEMATAMEYFDYTSNELRGFARGTVEEIRHGTATYDSGNPSGHKISGINANNMATLIRLYISDYTYTSTELQGYCNGVSEHVMTDGIVTYTGPTPPSSPDYCENGTISGLNGSVLANLIMNYAGYPYVTTKLLAECTAIVNHIMNNAQVETGVIT